MKYVFLVFILISGLSLYLFSFNNQEEVVGQAVEPIKKTETKTPIKDSLEGKTSHEKQDIKATELTKLDILGKEISQKNENLEIEVIGQATKIEVNGQFGVEVFVRAWKNGKQLGFSKDGSVDIERFRIFNPPILVEDPLGEIVESYVNQLGETVETRYREDPEAALKEVLSRLVTLHGQPDARISTGKIGNTTDTFAPSMDGAVYRWGTDATWTAARDTADGLSTDETSSPQYFTSEFRTGPNRYQNTRGFFVFDTSAIPDTNTIDSAFLEIESDSDDLNISAWGIQEGTPASESALATGDYDAMTINSPTRLATDVSPSGTAGVRNTWTLNSSGLTAIDKTGNTVLVLRAARDMDNSAPVARSYWTARMVNAVGTADDPLLSVTHSAPASETTTGMNIMIID